MSAIIAIKRIINYVRSKLCRKIIYCNKYVQRAYDLCCKFISLQRMNTLFT